jgi:hypothetical protein
VNVLLFISIFYNVSNCGRKITKKHPIYVKFVDLCNQLNNSIHFYKSLSKLLSQRDADVDEFVEFSSKEYVQRSLEGYLELLKNRKPKQQQ